MTGKVFRSIATLFVVLTTPTLVAAQTPVSLTGTWNMSLMGDHAIPVGLVLEQNGSALKATFILMGKDYPLTGEVTGKTFTLKGQGPGFGRASHDPAAAAPPATTQQQPRPALAMAEITINGTTDADGALSGQMHSKTGDRTGTMRWTADRLKERPVPAAAVSTEAVDMTGKWTLHVVEAQLDVALDLKQAGTTITGTATSDHLGTMALEGTLAHGTLTFSTKGSTSGEIKYTGAFRTNGTFAGDLASQMGTMTWTLAQVKK